MSKFYFKQVAEMMSSKSGQKINPEKVVEIPSGDENEEVLLFAARHGERLILLYEYGCGTIYIDIIWVTKKQ